MAINNNYTRNEHAERNREDEVYAHPCHLWLKAQVGESTGLGTCPVDELSEQCT